MLGRLINAHTGLITPFLRQEVQSGQVRLHKTSQFNGLINDLNFNQPLVCEPQPLPSDNIRHIRYKRYARHVRVSISSIAVPAGYLLSA
jgi:hypothetical protein